MRRVAFCYDGSGAKAVTYKCPHCGAELPEKTNYCHQCGAAVMWEWLSDVADDAATQSNEAVAGQMVSETPAYSGSEPLPMPENVAAVISYITIVPATLFLVLRPFNRNRFVRFHSLQHLLLFTAALASAIAAAILWMLLDLIPPMRVLVFPFVGLVSLAWFFVWLLLVVKAYHHQWFKLPYLGDYAEAWSRT
jgi:uncharacterized membrane protein